MHFKQLEIKKIDKNGRLQKFTKNTTLKFLFIAIFTHQKTFNTKENWEIKSFKKSRMNKNFRSLTEIFFTSYSLSLENSGMNKKPLFLFHS